MLAGIEEEEEVMKEQQGLPPGFRFHPTDEELVTYYLASKVYNINFNFNFNFNVHIAEVDLNRCEPWDLPDGCKMGEREWYLYSLRDRKYPTGVRTNRATRAGYWKATGKDRQVLSGDRGRVIGMKKTLVFYNGRAPRGLKTKWVMHEYRLHPPSFSSTKKEEWVICRIYHKPVGGGGGGVGVAAHGGGGDSVNDGEVEVNPSLNPNNSLMLNSYFPQFQPSLFASNSLPNTHFQPQQAIGYHNVCPNNSMLLYGGGGGDGDHGINMDEYSGLLEDIHFHTSSTAVMNPPLPHNQLTLPPLPHQHPSLQA